MTTHRSITLLLGIFAGHVYMGVCEDGKPNAGIACKDPRDIKHLRAFTGGDRGSDYEGEHGLSGSDAAMETARSIDAILAEGCTPSLHGYGFRDDDQASDFVAHLVRCAELVDADEQARGWKYLLHPEDDPWAEQKS